MGDQGLIKQVEDQVMKLTDQDKYTGAYLTTIMSIAAISVCAVAMERNGFQWYSWW